MTKNLIFSIFLSIFLVSCAENSILKSTIPDDTGKSEKQKSMERKLEKGTFDLPKDSPLWQGQGIFDTEGFLNFGNSGDSFAIDSILLVCTRQN